MKAMISQPMNGKSNEEIREERKTLVDKLKQDGIEVLDTVFDEAPKDCNEAIYYLSKSIEFIGKADVIYFMKGWEKARGCKIEHEVAAEYGKECRYVEE